MQNKLNMPRLIIVVFVLALTGCNTGSGTNATGSAPAIDTPHADAATTGSSRDSGPSKEAAGDKGAVVFTLNGQPAQYSPDTHQSAQFGNGHLHIYINGFLPPDTYNHQMELWIKNFDEKTGMHTAVATYMRRDENKQDFIYEGHSFRVNITAYAITGADTSGSNIGNAMHPHAFVSGTFEGDLLYTIPDPTRKNNPLAQPQHITNGKFDNLKVIYLR